MTDTPHEILKMQYKILASKPLEERFRMQIELMEYGVKQTKEFLRKQHPQISERELNVEFFKLYYRDDFPQDEMDKIVEWMRKG